MAEILTGYNLTLSSQYSAATKWNQRMLVSKTTLKAFGGKVRLKLKAHGTVDCTMTGCSIGPRDGSTYNFASAPTRVTVGGSNSWNMPAGTTVTTDWITFDLNPATDYLVHNAWVTDSTTALVYDSASTNNGRAYKESSTDDTLTESLSGYTTDSYYCTLVGVEVEATDVAKRRYRLVVTANDGDLTYLTVSRLSLMIGGVDQCSGGYARGSSLLVALNYNYSPGTSFDTDYTDASFGWTAASGTLTGWLEYELDTAKDIESYSVRASSNNADTAPHDFTLNYWDGSQWVEVDAQTGQTGWAIDETRVFMYAESSIEPMICVIT